MTTYEWAYFRPDPSRWTVPLIFSFYVLNNSNTEGGLDAAVIVYPVQILRLVDHFYFIFLLNIWWPMPLFLIFYFTDL
jgi:hypothetical protein